MNQLFDRVPRPRKRDGKSPAGIANPNDRNGFHETNIAFNLEEKDRPQLGNFKYVAARDRIRVKNRREANCRRTSIEMAALLEQTYGRDQ